MPTQPHTCAPQCPKELSLPEAQYYLDRVIEELPSHSKVPTLIKVSYSGVVHTHAHTHTYTRTHTHTHTHTHTCTTHTHTHAPHTGGAQQ